MVHLKPEAAAKYCVALQHGMMGGCSQQQVVHPLAGCPGHACRKHGQSTFTPSVTSLGLVLCACRYRIHCLGHSLGGGVAALAAYLLRTSPELREQLQGASGVMATGEGWAIWGGGCVLGCVVVHGGLCGCSRVVLHGAELPTP